MSDDSNLLRPDEYDEFDFDDIPPLQQQDESSPNASDSHEDEGDDFEPSGDSSTDDRGDTESKEIRSLSASADEYDEYDFDDLTIDALKNAFEALPSPPMKPVPDDVDTYDDFAPSDDYHHDWKSDLHHGDRDEEQDRDDGEISSVQSIERTEEESTADETAPEKEAADEQHRSDGSSLSMEDRPSRYPSRFESMLDGEQERDGIGFDTMDGSSDSVSDEEFKRRLEERFALGAGMREDSARSERMDSVEDTQSPELTETDLKPIIESLIFASDSPISLSQLRTFIFGEAEKQTRESTKSSRNRGADEVPGGADVTPPRQKRSAKRNILTPSAMKRIVNHLNKDYVKGNRPFRIVEIGGGYTFQTVHEMGLYVGRMYVDRAKRRLTQSALDTLAIIAFKQPISKPKIEEIRGVNSDFVLKSLLERDLIRLVGRDPGIGRPLLYGTTDTFLHHFGLASVSDLPKPREIDELLSDENIIGPASIDEPIEHEVPVSDIEARTEIFNDVPVDPNEYTATIDGENGAQVSGDGEFVAPAAGVDGSLTDAPRGTSADEATQTLETGSDANADQQEAPEQLDPLSKLIRESILSSASQWEDDREYRRLMRELDRLLGSRPTPESVEFELEELDDAADPSSADKQKTETPVDAPAGGVHQPHTSLSEDELRQAVKLNEEMRQELLRTGQRRSPRAQADLESFGAHLRVDKLLRIEARIREKERELERMERDLAVLNSIERVDQLGLLLEVGFKDIDPELRRMYEAIIKDFEETFAAPESKEAAKALFQELSKGIDLSDFSSFDGSNPFTSTAATSSDTSKMKYPPDPQDTAPQSIPRTRDEYEHEE